MSLSKAIIYKSVDTVIKLINKGAKLDVIDEYGYTPLVQTAIMNSASKAAVIINAGASIDFADLTGHTALYWAADNNNLTLCKLFLDHNANPNAYTTAGQPVLVMPLLRKQQKLIKLLCKHGADIEFAKDFINTKLLAHRYELKGHVDIADNTNTFIEINYEGFYLEFTLAIISSSLADFKNSFGSRHLRSYFDYLKRIIKSFKNASDLIQYQHYNTDICEHEEKINALLNHDLLLIPIACEGHAISLIKYGNIFAYCDRGMYGEKHGPINIYKMGNPDALTHELIKKLIYTHQPKHFIESDMQALFDLTLIHKLPLPLQTTGNCSWANVEAAIPTLMFLLLQEDSKESVEDCQQSALYFYEEWLEWEKNHALHQFVYHFDNLSKARKATKAALLASILFQKCDFKNDQDFKRAKKIVPILTNPEFEYIIKNYIDIFIAKHKTEKGKNLAEILENFGIDVED
jgi:hypothetical protein